MKSVNSENRPLWGDPLYDPFTQIFCRNIATLRFHQAVESPVSSGGIGHDIVGVENDRW